jgi:hypothetical protein
VNVPLEEGEIVLYKTKRHPALLFVCFIAALVLAVPSYGISFVIVIPPLFQLRVSGYIVTNMRILARHRIFQPEPVEIRMGDITEAGVGEGPLDAKLGKGRLVLKARETFFFNGVKNPEAFLSYVRCAKLMFLR